MSLHWAEKKVLIVWEPAQAVAASAACAAASYAAAAAANIEVVPDVGDFTTWQPGTWGGVDFDKIPFPTDPMLSICSVRSYFAVAMILWHDTALRAKHSHAWDSLTAAWKATFHHDLTASSLEKWPEDGPHGFSKASTLRCRYGTPPVKRPLTYCSMPKSMCK